jgi:hypothetical protein
MAVCPNCGRRTMRTKDWVCQWCGYPLLNGNYKQIDKTYKELQEERDESWKSIKPEPEPAFDFEEEETESEAETKQPETEWKQEQKTPHTPKPPPAPEPQTKPEAIVTAAPEPAPEPLATPQNRPAPSPAAEPLPQAGPEPVIHLGPGPSLAPPAPPAPVPAPQPAPETKPEALLLPALDAIVDGSELTIDQIDGLFRANSVGANEALKDKTLIIKGMVSKIFIREHLDIRYLILTGTGRAAWSVRCGFGKESVTYFSRLNEGQMVTLRGRYDGYGKNIIFKDCTLAR